MTETTTQVLTSGTVDTSSPCGPAYYLHPPECRAGLLTRPLPRKAMTTAEPLTII